MTEEDEKLLAWLHDEKQQEDMRRWGISYASGGCATNGLTSQLYGPKGKTAMGCNLFYNDDVPCPVSPELCSLDAHQRWFDFLRRIEGAALVTRLRIQEATIGEIH